MTTTLRRSTAGELFGAPGDGFRYEPVKGELRRMSPPEASAAQSWSTSRRRSPGT
jgi:hypothetical protein